jgi:nitric oxide reductase large subunit
MGWADCGKNSKTGQNMGYGWPGVCHAKGCKEKIDRGLSYVCGGMHEGDIYGCGYYFCEKHLTMVWHPVTDEGIEQAGQLCHKCAKSLEDALAEEHKDEIAAMEEEELAPA